MRDSYAFKCTDEDFDLARILKEAREDGVKALAIKQESRGRVWFFFCNSLYDRVRDEYPSIERMDKLSLSSFPVGFRGKQKTFGYMSCWTEKRRYNMVLDLIDRVLKQKKTHKIITFK